MRTPTISVGSDIASQLDSLKSELTSQQKMVSELNKEKSELQTKVNKLDKELKKASAVIAKDKEKQAMHQLLQENLKLKKEIEMYTEVNNQNEALRENIKHVGKISEETTKKYEAELNEAKQTIEKLKSSSPLFSSSVQFVASTPSETSPNFVTAANSNVNSATTSKSGSLTHTQEPKVKILDSTLLNEQSVDSDYQLVKQERDHLFMQQQILERQLKETQTELQTLKHQQQDVGSPKRLSSPNVHLAPSSPILGESHINQLRLDNQILVKENAFKNQELSKLKKQLDEFRNAQAEHEVHINSLTIQNKQSQGTVQNLQKTVADQETQLAKYQQQEINSQTQESAQQHAASIIAKQAREIENLKEQNLLLALTAKEGEILIEKMKLTVENKIISLKFQYDVKEQSLSSEIQKLSQIIESHSQLHTQQSSTSQLQDSLNIITREKEELMVKLSELQRLNESQQQELSLLRPRNPTAQANPSDTTLEQLQAGKQSFEQQIQTLQHEITRLRSSMKGKEEFIKSLTVQVDHLQKDLENSEEAKSSAIQTLELHSVSDSQAMADYHYQITKLKTDVDKHLNACFEKDTQLRMKASENKELKQQVDNLKLELEELRNKFNEIPSRDHESSEQVPSEEEIAAMKSNIQRLKETLRKLSDKLHDQQMENTNLQYDLTNMNWKLDEVTEKKEKELQVLTESYMEQIYSLHSEIAILFALHECGKEQLGDHETETVEGTLNQTLREVPQQEDLTATEEEIAEMKNKNAQLKDTLRKLSDKLSEQQKENMNLQYDLTNMKWKMDEVKEAKEKEIYNLTEAYIDQISTLHADVSIIVAHSENESEKTNDLENRLAILNEELDNLKFQSNDHEKIFSDTMTSVKQKFDQHIEDLENQVKSLKIKNEQLLEEKESEHEREQDQIKLAGDSAQMHQDQIHELTIKLDELTSKLTTTQENYQHEVQSLSSKVTEYETQVSNLKTEHLDFSSQIEQKYKQDVEESQQKINSLEKKVNLLQQELKETNVQLESEREGAKNLINSKIQEYQSRCHELEVELLGLESQLEKAKDNEAHLKKQLEEQSVAIANMTSEAIASRSESNPISNSTGTMTQSQIEDLVSNYEQKLQTLTNELTNMQQKLKEEVQVMQHKHEETLKEIKNQYEQKMKEVQEIQSTVRDPHDKQKQQVSGSQSSNDNTSEFEGRYGELQRLYQESEKKIESLQNVIIERSETIEKYEKSAAAHQKEVDTLKKRMAQDKEAHQILVMNLQEQLANIPQQASAIPISSSHQQHTAKNGSGGNQTEAVNNDRLKKEKIELEDKLKKEKLKYQTEIEKLKKDLQVLENSKTEITKNFEKDMLARSEEISREKQRIKQLENDMAHLRTETNKLMQDMQKKAMAVEQDSVAKIHSVDAVLKEKEYISREHEMLKKNMENLESEKNLLNAELEVQKSAHERVSKTVAEKEESIKKLRQKVDELQKSESQSKVSLSQLEKQVDELKNLIQSYENKTSQQESILQTQLSTLKEQKDGLDSQLEELKTQLERANFERDEAIEKMDTVQKEMKTLEKKSNQMVKDLQKQLMKEKKNTHGEDHNVNHSGENKLTVEGMTTTRSRRSTITPSSSLEQQQQQQPGVPKVEKLTDDLILLAHENELLNKRVKFAEDELKVLTDRLNYLSEETEKKSKVIQQYVLRENQGKILPESTKLPGFNLTMLSSQSQVQKLDPVMLSQINTKLQKLVEDLSSKVILMESELNSIRRNSKH